MRLEINSGGLDSFFNGISTFFNSNKNSSKTDKLIKSIEKVENKTEDLTGGVGSLSSALGYLRTRKSIEENRQVAIDNVKKRTDSLIQTAKSVDKSVAQAVTMTTEKFYQTNPWLRPPEPANALEKLWDGMIEVAEYVWGGLVEFYEEHPIISKVLIAAAVLAVTYCTFGISAAAFATLGKVVLVSGTVQGIIGSVSGGLENGFEGFVKGACEGFINGAADGLVAGSIGLFAGGILGTSTKLANLAPKKFELLKGGLGNFVGDGLDSALSGDSVIEIIGKSFVAIPMGLAAGKIADMSPAISKHTYKIKVGLSKINPKKIDMVAGITDDIISEFIENGTKKGIKNIFKYDFKNIDSISEHRIDNLLENHINILKSRNLFTAFE